MPELPEVECFRHLLLPLVQNKSGSGSGTLTIERIGDNPRIHWSDGDLGGLQAVSNHGFVCTSVLRRGKQLCLVLKDAVASQVTRYLYLHMGMTGRIRVPGRAENWGAKQQDGTVVKTDLDTISGSGDSGDEALPPKYTYLVFSVGITSSPSSKLYTAYFCDPRKFGSCYLSDSLSDLEELAPDALTCDNSTTIEERILPALSNQRLGIKAILLDQKRAVSGVGNWVADEVLYQCEFHPDQTHLTRDEAVILWHTLQSILTVAVHALTIDNTHYPENWLFGYRWTKKKVTRDALGRSVTFLKSGGRTSAIVPSIQKLYSRKTESSKCIGRTKSKDTSTRDSSRVGQVSVGAEPPAATRVTRKRSSTSKQVSTSTIEELTTRKSPRFS
jgi:formamidopyrimidine-DNA glycosylase